jgi:hypothetical protein
MTWHADADTLVRYRDGLVRDAEAFSLEAHIVGCPECQAGLAAVADRERLELSWLEIEDALDRPAPSLAERVLRRLGAGDSTARLVATTPALGRAWLAAVSLALLFAVFAAHLDPRGETLFLALAPLVPVAGVAISFGPRIDPLHEVALAAPFSATRVLLLRAAAVLATGAALAAVAALAVPGLGWTAAGWLLPALALVLVALALAARVEPAVAAAATAAGWLALVAILTVASGDRLAAFALPVQLGVGLLAAAAGAMLAAAGRRDAYERLVGR